MSSFLNDTWSLFFHDPNDVSWAHDSYTRIADVGTVEEFWKIFDHIAPHAHEGIWFCFREHVFPCWDDPGNIKGGCLSIKVAKADTEKVLQEICVRMLGESLLVPEFADKCHMVNGVSVSPKRSFCIVKIWLGSADIGDIRHFQLGNVAYDGDVFYKNNTDNITHNNLRLTNAATGGTPQ